MAPVAWPQAASDGTLEEVMVTAQRVSEDLQKAAIAVTALSAESLTEAGVSQAEDLSKLVPGVHIAQGGPSSQVYVRGVGNYGTNALADPAVAFNLDGIYLARFSGISGNFYDLERVEVLKGPQGTLYGRNATGGAINIVSKKPDTAALAGGVGAELGNYSLRKINGYINVPVSGTVAIRGAFQSTDRDGYQTDGYDDDVTKSVRLGLKWDANEDTSLLVTGLYTDVGGRGSVHVPINRNGFYDNSNPWVGQSIAAPPLLRLIGPPPNPNWQVTGVSRADGNLDVQVKSLTAEFNTKVGASALTLLGNHMVTDNDSKSYGPGFLFYPKDKATQDSIEARLAGESGPIKWVGGLYGFREHQVSKYWVDQGYAFNQTGVDLNKLDDETAAAFAQITYSITDRARLTGGVRFTRETKEMDGQTFNREGRNGPPIDAFDPSSGQGCPAGNSRVLINTGAAAIPQAATNTDGTAYAWPYCRDTMTGKITFNDTSWKVGADFDVAENSLLYVSVAKGFKAGGYFAAGDHADLTGNTVEPEKLLAYAVGSKNRIAGNRLQVNGEAFYWDYKNHQESYLAPLYSGAVSGFGFVTQQADAHIYGLDLEIDARITENDKLSAKLQYLHSEYTRASFINASPGPGNPPPVTVCATSQSTVNPAVWFADCAGQQMPRSPTTSGNVDYSHTFPLANGAGVEAGAGLQYSAQFWAAVDYNPLQLQKSYTTYSADLTFHSPSRKWSVTAWGQNLGDEVIYSNAFMYPASNNGTNSTSFTQLRAPRTYGLRAAANF